MLTTPGTSPADIMRIKKDQRKAGKSAAEAAAGIVVRFTPFRPQAGEFLHES